MEQVNIWGVRGSFPITEDSVREYGGNTSCVSISTRDALIILDAGTGLHNLGNHIENGKLPIHILISHYHLDHLLGLFEFAPLFDANREIHIWGPEADGEGVKEKLDAILAPPYWPVTMSQMGAKITFHTLTVNQEFSLSEDITITTYPTNHPNGGLLYRVETPEGIYAYGLDNEVEPGQEETLLSLYQDADYGFFDAAILPEDKERYKGWGHSTWLDGKNILEKANVKHMVMQHFSIDATDDILEREEAKANLLLPERMIFAKEGMMLCKADGQERG